MESFQDGVFAKDIGWRIGKRREGVNRNCQRR
jgi:hypothetical protein